MPIHSNAFMLSFQLTWLIFWRSRIMISWWSHRSIWKWLPICVSTFRWLINIKSNPSQFNSLLCLRFSLFYFLFLLFLMLFIIVILFLSLSRCSYSLVNTTSLFTFILWISLRFLFYIGNETLIIKKEFNQLNGFSFTERFPHFFEKKY